MPDVFDVPLLSGAPRARIASGWRVVRADRAEVEAYRAIRRDVFVEEQAMFSERDADRIDDDPRTIVLVAVDDAGLVLGGVRLAPAMDGRDIGWWTGSRLAVRRDARRAGGIGSALVREACAVALERGVLRFEATVQEANEPLFRHLGWRAWGRTDVAAVPHVRMRWPIDRIRRLVDAAKADLADVVGGIRGDGPASLGGPGFVGDDGAPVPGTDVVAACDAILPAMVERDPEWAGWCAVLVNVNDLSAMGAAPSGLLDAIGAPTASFAHRIVGGIRAASEAWAVPVLGGHTQLGVAPSLSVTALGRTDRPVRGGGGHAGHGLSLTVDVSGRWRRGFEGRQWDSTSSRSGAELRELASLVGRAAPDAAKDVSMAGVVGTAAMMAEASGTGATIEVARVPAPATVSFGDWLTCFPGFGMLTADRAGHGRMRTTLAPTASIGSLDERPGVRLRWPDGVETDAVDAATGLGAAGDVIQMHSG
ncbi:MSMEG_0567/sll0787 family protein [Microbacterium marinilacus]|uniref:GNAT family N-acetyltransferase n=1 Tax=Microbacterium marinilacus TaxID=415209 RepID=A0ABP7B997_9MICO|nr:MSMEG_0567/sll0787 family protein [Microbacterium marinilacus]MBY0687363.1 GNAT family N-acetyltransferase [Microbacterium marinilacus]